jgi:hypothetical protein
MSHLCWQCRQHKHFGFSNIRFTRRSIVKCVGVVMVVAVSLHHRSSDDLYKIQKENANLTWAVIYVTLRPFLWALLYMWVLDCSEGNSGMSIAVLLAVESVHLPHCQRHPVRQRQWTKLTCRTVDNRLIGGTVGIVTALAPISETYLTWQCVTLSLHCRQCQQSIHILHLATANAICCLVVSFYTNTHRTMKCWLGRNNLSVQQSALDLNTAPKSEKWNTICSF